MQILLQGKNSQLTITIESMLSSVKDWQVTQISSYSFSTDEKGSQELNKANYDIIVSNLADYTIPGKELIKTITSHFPSSPLAVLHVFGRELFIKPLIDAGARSYIQLGVSEQRLKKAIEITSEGNQHIDVKNTYKE